MGASKLFLKEKVWKIWLLLIGRSDVNNGYNQKTSVVKGQQFVDIDFNSQFLMFNL